MGQPKKTTRATALAGDGASPRTRRMSLPGRRKPGLSCLQVNRILKACEELPRNGWSQHSSKNFCKNTGFSRAHRGAVSLSDRQFSKKTSYRPLY